MAIHFGKPGTRKIVGVQRAQLQEMLRHVNSSLAYQIKVQARNPPQNYIPPISQPTFAAMKMAVTAMLAEVN